MDFLDSLNNKQTLIFDGAMGSMLAKSGVTEGSGEANLAHGDVVRRIHRLYVEAGADCLITNTLSLNAAYMKKAGQLAILGDALRAGIEHALAASNGQALVFGDMGPSGDLLAPYGPGEPDALYEAFCQQAETFAAWPLSGIIIETVFQWAEAELMLRACRESAPQLPVILSMTFANTKLGGRTVMGDKAADIAVKAAALGAAAVGANCGDLSPLEFTAVMEAMSAAKLPLIAQPNAGKPQVSGLEVSYNLQPQQFAAEMLEVHKAGAALLGGCCGTTPAHIAALAGIMK